MRLSELLPGTEVTARGLRWELVYTQNLGSQILHRLRGIDGHFGGQEIDRRPVFQPPRGQGLVTLQTQRSPTVLKTHPVVPSSSNRDEPYSGGIALNSPRKCPKRGQSSRLCPELRAGRRGLRPGLRLPGAGMPDSGCRGP